MVDDLAPRVAAPQQSRAPRPLPLFLRLVEDVARTDPDLARAALRGLRRYSEADPPPPPRQCPILFDKDGASLRKCGGTGPTLILVPSLINPPSILDLDERCSLADALSSVATVLLLDWGPAARRSRLDLADHLDALLLPLIRESGAALLIGYCLGGTLALAAAQRSPSIQAVITLAAPWHFSAYEDEVRSSLRSLWDFSKAPAAMLEALPMEVLQTAFWSIDPRRTVAKFANLADMPAGSPDIARFVALEDWANSGEPLPLPAARELVGDLFGHDITGQGRWRGGQLPTCQQLHVTAGADRIVPKESRAAGPSLEQPAGHVGMIVGQRAPTLLHAPLRSWVEGLKLPR